MTIPTISALPTPPTRSDPANFASRGDSFMAALPTLQSEINAVTAAIPGEVDTVATATATSVANSAAYAGGLAAASGLPPEFNRLVPAFYDDFIQGNTTGTWDIDLISSGTTANAITSTSDMAQHPGILYLRSSSTINSGVLLKATTGTPSNINRIVGGEVFEVVFKTPVTQTSITMRCGFHDATTVTAPVDGLYFEIVAGAVVAKNTSNSVSTTSATIVTLSASTWYTLRIDVNSDATSVNYNIYNDTGDQQGATVTQTTNIPTAIGRECEPAFIITYGVAAVVDLCWIDYLYFGYTTPRVRGPSTAKIKFNDFSVTVNSATPNATVPAHIITPLSNATNVDIVLSSKGTGALIRDTPNNLTSGGNKRGADAVDLQSIRVAASEVASGSGSFIAGKYCTASGISSMALGYNNNVAGQYSLGLGFDSVVSDNNAFAFSGSTRQPNSAIFGLARFEAVGASISTTDATVTTIEDTGTVTVKLADNNSVYLDVKVKARITATGDTKSWSGKILAKRGTGAASTSIVGSPTLTSDFGDTALSAATATIAADTTNGGINIRATGIAATTIVWTVNVTIL